MFTQILNIIYINKIYKLQLTRTKNMKIFKSPKPIEKKARAHSYPIFTDKELLLLWYIIESSFRFIFCQPKVYSLALYTYTYSFQFYSTRIARFILAIQHTKKKSKEKIEGNIYNFLVVVVFSFISVVFSAKLLHKNPKFHTQYTRCVCVF